MFLSLFSTEEVSLVPWRKGDGMDKRFMKKAIELAKKGEGFVNPNPLVGAVLVKGCTIVGEGYHEIFGGPHAEVNAVRGVDAKDATLYVTLEPCNHYGKTPPCVELIINSEIKKVVIGMLDPNPLMAGKSVDILKAEGIEVEVGVLEAEIREMNKVFIKNMTEKIPYVVMKTAMTADGKIATGTGKSKWISGAESRAVVHRMRHAMMGIMVGIGTVLEDNPSLTVRLESLESKITPIIVDSKGRLPLSSKVLKEHSGKVIVATTSQMDGAKKESLIKLGVTIILAESPDGRVDLNKLMKELGYLSIDSILLEGGSSLNASALEAGIVDEVVSFIGPKIFGGSDKTPVGGNGIDEVSDAVLLSPPEVEILGSDVMVKWKVRKCSQG